MICQTAFLPEIITEVDRHFPGAEQVEVVSAVKGVVRPVDLYFVPVVVGVHILHAALLRELRHRVVHPDVVAECGAAAVEHQLDVPLPAVIQHEPEQHLLPGLDRVDLFVRPVVIIVARVGLNSFIDQVALVVLPDARAFHPVFPNVVVLDEREPEFEILGKPSAQEVLDALIPEKIVRLPEDDLDRLRLERCPYVKVGLGRFLQIASHVVSSISVVVEQLHRCQGYIADTVPDI